MPEGPSIVILKEAVKRFTGKKVLEVSGNSRIDQTRLVGQKVIAFRSWGKHFLICFNGFSLRVHFLLFGSYLVNETKDRPVRLALKFSNGELNLYACAIRFIEEDLNELYDWSVDVMSDDWSPRRAMSKLKNCPEALACDVLLNQDIFAGVGNIIKNEVLFRVKVHPESRIGQVPLRKTREIVKEARIYSFQFLDWKKQFVLKKHWLAHTKKTCVRCDIPLVKKHTGKSRRRSFFCINCQMLYD
jgi:endonuclease-8